MNRGYFGIAFFKPKTPGNFGAAIRSAHCFGASFVVLIGHRYRREPEDTTHAGKHMPIFEYSTIDAFLDAAPRLGTLVRVEVDSSNDIRQYKHPERAIYLLGGEDLTLPSGLPGDAIRIETPLCLNMAVAASIVLYDRHAKVGTSHRLVAA